MSNGSVRRRRGLGVLAGLALAGASPAALAFETEIALPLTDLNLDGSRSATAAEVRLPPSLTVQRAALIVGYANALAVEPETSGLTISLNGSALAELPLVAAQGEVAAELELPARLFESAGGRIDFVARQRHRIACSRDGFAELWTRIDAETSRLRLDVRPEPGRATLANLDGILGASLYDGETLQVAAARPVADAALLEWGGLVAEGVALRRGGRPLTVEPAQLAAGTRVEAGDGRPAIDLRTARGRNVVVVGTLDELRDLLPPNLPNGAALGMIAVRPLPDDPLHVALLISGENDAAVTRAAQAFRAPEHAWPAVAAMAVDFAPAGEGPRLRPVLERAVEGGARVRLADLGYRTADLPLGVTDPVDVELTLPETYYAGDGQKIQLALDFAYGAGLAAHSALIIRLNGAPWNMLRLDDPDGHIVSDARVELPMGLFRPGRNVIGFEPVLHPGAPELCAVAGDQPMFSLFDDSEIEVPAFAHLARQPDLKLFAGTAYPYGTDAEGVELVLGSLEPETVAAAWTLRGKLAQQRGAPLSGIQTVRRPTGTRHILAVGLAADLPPELVAASPLPLGSPMAGGDRGAPVVTASSATPAALTSQTGEARQHWSHRLALDAGGHDGGVLDTMSRWIVSMARAVPMSRPPAAPTFVELEAGEREKRGTIVAFRSPYAQNRTATVITASDQPALAGAVAQLVRPAVWDRISGDVSVWSDHNMRVLSHQVAETYVIRPVDKSPRHLWLLWRTVMAERLGLWLVLSLGLVGLLTAATGGLLRRRARQIAG